MATEDELYALIARSTPDAIIFADRRGVIRVWNGGAEQMFGHTAAEAIGQTLDIIIPDRLRARHWENYDRVMETGETKYGRGDLLAVPAIRKDGSRISIEFTISLLRDEEGKVMGPAAIIRDVTERWQRERELRERITALESAVAETGAAARQDG